MRRHVTTIEEIGRTGLLEVCRLARDADGVSLAGEGVALVFERPSLRTRASSSVAVTDLGGHPTFFTGDEIGIDSRESAEDVARTIAAYFPIAALRVRDHGVLTRMREATGDRLSVINLLSNEAHPTQAIADLLTLADHFSGGAVEGLRGLEVAYVGDATNVARSLCVALRLVGARVRVASPERYRLARGRVEDPGRVASGSLVEVDDVGAGVRGADAVYTDAWVSMGAEAEAEQRRRDLRQYRVTPDLLDLAGTGAVFLHCLPAHRGDEVVDAVLDGPRSLIWEQAAHRRSAMRGALAWVRGAA